MPEKDPLQTEMVTVPRSRLLQLEAVIVQVIRRAAEAQSHVTQQLGAELEELLVALDGDVSRHDTLVRIWGPAARRPEKGEPGPMPAIAEEEQATV